MAVLGAGLSGMATALRLQAAGLSTVVFEAHGHAGGCAGYFRRRGFSFDVGATTLVDFEPGGVGAELLTAVGVPDLDGEALPGYRAWLPDRTLTLHRDPAARAPRANAALGITIRGAGLTRHRGGMHGFWRALVSRYRELGGALWLCCPVERVTGDRDGYTVRTRRGTLTAGQVVSALPAASTAAITAGTAIAARLRLFLTRDRESLGGAAVVFLGVPEDEVAGQPLTHHQFLQDYRRPLGAGNNMFVSVSAPGDTDSAPPGHRAVMISTHAELADWTGLREAEYQSRKLELGDRLVGYARRAYPCLGDRAVVRMVGTPRSYQRWAFRPDGAVGGVRQTLRNSNQHALPHDSGTPGFWLVGDSTWPGLGTVACVLGSRIVADGVRRHTRRVAAR